jgi:hypothetical protein
MNMREPKVYPVKKCLTCGNDHTKYGLYCGRTCANNKTIREKISVGVRLAYARGAIRQCQTLEWLSETKSFIRGQHIRKVLVKHGRPDECAKCKLGLEWQGEPLVLQADHIDGDRCNNSPENIQLLCPNCHSQTKNWSGRNAKRNKEI